MKFKSGSIFFGIFFVFSALGLLSIQKLNHNAFSVQRMKPKAPTLEEALLSLGGAQSEHFMNFSDPQKVKIGKDLVEKGRTKRGLFKSKVISPYFVCTDCHNVGREFENANEQSPEKRLEYAKQNGLPFLPGSTLWGIYNRTDFYNDDYIQKYGEIVIPAKKSLSESIQVCAKYCSSGRSLKDWEVEAIMHYFKKNELQLRDVDLTPNQTKNILNPNKLTKKEKSELLKVLKLSFVSGFSADFIPTMPAEDRKYGRLGDLDNGKYIFENACLFCHRDGRVTYLKLDDNKLTAEMFVKHMKGYSDKSVYQITRFGTFTIAGRNQYMPRYTKDKMSDEQIEDLMAYIQQMAKK